MTAIISNISDYQRPKVTEKTFKFWSDNRFRTRVELLEQIKLRGIEYFGSQQEALLQSCFPNGFDPRNHPEDNLEVVLAEGARRGVFTP